MLTQRRIKGYIRTPYHTAVIDAIERAIEKECARYNVSRSFVIANALAYTFGIKTESYIPKEKKVVKFKSKVG